ncbi:MAG: hypothetical protein ACXVDN_03815 [Ktedonobacteraceae bacterium]
MGTMSIDHQNRSKPALTTPTKITSIRLNDWRSGIASIVRAKRKSNFQCAVVDLKMVNYIQMSIDALKLIGGEPDARGDRCNWFAWGCPALCGAGQGVAAGGVRGLRADA